VPGETPTPLAGAVVAFDPPGGGERVEKTSGPDGRVVFEADFSSGAATVTAFAADHALLTVVGVTPERVAKNKLKASFGHPDDLVLVMPPLGSWLEKRTVKLSGAITGKTSSRLNVGPIGLGTIFDATTSTYELRVPKGSPFVLLGSDYAFTKPDARSFEGTIAKFFTIDRPATSQDGTFDVDVAGASTVATVTNKIHLVIPGGDAGPLGGGSFGAVNVLDHYRMFFPGVIKRAAPSADKAGFDCEVTVAQIDPKPWTLVTAGSIRTPEGAVSIRGELGVLPDGSTMTDFLLPPKLSFDRAKRSAPIALGETPADVEAVSLTMLDGDRPAWTVVMPRAYGIPTSLTVPAPPTGASVASSLIGQVVYSRDALLLPDDILLEKTTASSASFPVEK
jgi:hypothetical protein